MAEPATPAGADSPLGRRRLLRAGGAAGAGAGLVGLGALAGQLAGGADAPAGSEAPGADASEPALHGARTVPFHGEHQAGVETDPPAHATLLAYDLHPETDRAAIVRLLRILTEVGSRLTQGRPALADTEPELAVLPASLTITVGFGPGLLARAGIAAPAWLAPLPPFAIDELDPQLGDGDLLVQIAGDDPLTCAHALRMVSKTVRAFAGLRWSLPGFRRSYVAAKPGAAMRNLFGQVDGTANPQPGTPGFANVVWIPDGPLAGGTSLVVRRIRMDLDGWDELDRPGREMAVGRTLEAGAPLTGGDELTPADFEAVSARGFPVIPEFSHMRRARGVDEPDGGQAIYRRPYNYEIAAADGQIESGQMFLAFQADPLAQYLPIQQRLADLDLLNQWTTPIGSAVFLIPPGCAEGEHLGQSLLEG